VIPDPDALFKLVDAIYEAAFEPGRWSIALPLLVRTLNAEKGFLGFTQTVRGRTISSVAHEFAPEFLSHWQGEFGGSDPWYERAGNLPTGKVAQGARVIPLEDLRATEVHAALFQPFGIDDLICTSVAKHDRYFDFVTVHRSRRIGLFEESEMRAMRFLAPHLVRAAKIHDKLSHLSDARAAHEMLLDRLPYGVLLLDGRGRALGANQEAERILAASDGLRVRAGVVNASHPNTQKKLAAAVIETCDPARESSARAGALLTVPRPSAARAYQLLVVPVPERTGEQVFGFTETRTAGVMVVCDPESAPEPAAETLRRMFGLTPAVARLAAALAAGRTLAEHAVEARITQGSARWHLKELFARTGTRRQAELVRLLLGGIAQLRSSRRRLLVP
jgi:DNA-binding CsgD family transcriptional regulator/PAS domain-containing protein